MTLLRSPIDSNTADGPQLDDRFIPRIDQGEHRLNFWIVAGNKATLRQTIDSVTLAKNEPPYALSYFPPKTQSAAQSGILLSNPTIQLSAWKQAETGTDMIIQLYEPTGNAYTTTLEIPYLAFQTTLALQGFEIKTLCLNPESRQFHEVSLLEH
jgi:alpha-mannosidase